MRLDGPLPPLQEGRIIYHCVRKARRRMNASNSCAIPGAISSVNISPPWIALARQPAEKSATISS
jgi:hypothetical protein